VDERTYWKAEDLSIEDEPLVVSLLKYRQRKNRKQVLDSSQANLISSKTVDGRHMPILDLDFPHHFEESTTKGHTHLYIDVPMSRTKLFGLVLVLWWCGVIEMGHAVWTLRRGASFVRVPGVEKTEQESVKPTYGWFFKLRS